MSPQERLAAIRERLSKATPGRWVLDGQPEDALVWTPDQRMIADCGTCEGGSQQLSAEQRANADLIAHAGGTDGDLAWLLETASAAFELRACEMEMTAFAAALRSESTRPTGEDTQ